MILHDLIVETTRRCNMKCAHCLRGEPQNKSMPKKHLQSFLCQIEWIDSVTFTGGEPTLPSGLKVINEFMEVCRNFRIDVGSFYMVTNAKVWRPAIATTIIDLYEFCDNNEISYINISMDQYHDRITPERRRFRSILEEELWLYGIENIVEYRAERLLFEHIRAEGRGLELGAGRYEDIEDIYVDKHDDGYIVTEGSIYLNCDGNVVNGCDWSYETQTEEEYIICSVNDNFEEAIKKIAIIEEYA